MKEKKSNTFLSTHTHHLPQFVSFQDFLCRNWSSTLSAGQTASLVYLFQLFLASTSSLSSL